MHMSRPRITIPRQVVLMLSASVLLASGYAVQVAALEVALYVPAPGVEVFSA